MPVPLPCTAVSWRSRWTWQRRSCLNEDSRIKSEGTETLPAALQTHTGTLSQKDSSPRHVPISCSPNAQLCGNLVTPWSTATCSCVSMICSWGPPEEQMLWCPMTVSPAAVHPAVPPYTVFKVPTMSHYLSRASILPWQQLRNLRGFLLPWTSQ